MLLLGGAIAAIFLTPLRSCLTLENVRAVIAAAPRRLVRSLVAGTIGASA